MTTHMATPSISYDPVKRAAPVERRERLPLAGRTAGAIPAAMVRRSAGSGGSTHRREVAPELTASYDGEHVPTGRALVRRPLVARSIAARFGAGAGLHPPRPSVHSLTSPTSSGTRPVRQSRLGTSPHPGRSDRNPACMSWPLSNRMMPTAQMSVCWSTPPVPGAPHCSGEM